MIDVYPTLLDWMGWLEDEEKRAGMGASLLSSDPTLVEELGLERVNRILKADAELARFLWQ